MAQYAHIFLMAVCRHYPADRLLHRFERSGILLAVRIGKPQFAKLSRTDISDGIRLRIRACWLYRLVESIVGPIGGLREACCRVVYGDLVNGTGDLIRGARRVDLSLSLFLVFCYTV